MAQEIDTLGMGNGNLAPAAGTRLRVVVRIGLVAAALLGAAVGPVSGQPPDGNATETVAASAKPDSAERERVFARYIAQSAQLAEREKEIAREREAAARDALESQQQRAEQAVARRQAAETRGTELDRQWEGNEDRIAELTALLEQHQGNLGELFGVTRQVAADSADVLADSVYNAQLSVPAGAEARSDFVRRLAAAEALPSIGELRRLWLELLRETKASGEVVRFTADVLQAGSAEAKKREAVRIGTFTVVSAGDFLGYLPTAGKLTEFAGTLSPIFDKTALALQNAAADEGYVRAIVDPASGALLGLYFERPGFIERIENGEVVGYVIIAVGAIGLLAAVFQYAYLIGTGIKVGSQLQRLDEPRPDNPLGRVLLSAGPNGPSTRGASARNPELIELRLSEAVLHEIPKLERFQGFLRLAVAAGPLLGLIGTVIGMIITFKTITASGSSDPKLMAHGIGQAMIATVLGLGIAIPLLFVNAGLAARSRAIVQTLTEQRQALLAATIAAARKAVSPAVGHARIDAS